MQQVLDPRFSHHFSSPASPELMTGLKATKSVEKRFEKKKFDGKSIIHYQFDVSISLLAVHLISGVWRRENKSIYSSMAWLNN